MADQGFMSQGDKPVPSYAYNAHQDEFGFQEGNNDVHREPTGYGDTDNGVGGPKSGYGASKDGSAFDHATREQTQFGLEGKTGNYGRQGADPRLPGTTTKTNDFGDVVDPFESKFDKAPHGIESVPCGDGWSADDTCKHHNPCFESSDWLLIDHCLNGYGALIVRFFLDIKEMVGFAAPVHGSKKDDLMNKIKQKLPGQHELADGSVTNQPDPNAPPKKGMMEKIKEKLPGM